MLRVPHLSFVWLLAGVLLLMCCGPEAKAQVTYYEIVARHSGKCLDVSGGSTATGAAVVQWSCVGVANQHWQIIDVGGGYSKIVARHSGKVLEVSNANPANGAPVWQGVESGSPAQQWQITSVGGGYSKLTARHSGKVLDVPNLSTANGVQIIQWDYVADFNQQWLLRAVTLPSFSFYEIVARHSGKCLDVENASLANGARVQQLNCNGTTQQHWQISSLSGGYYKLLARHSGKAADVAGGGTGNGTLIHQWDSVGVANQQWQIINVGGNYFKLIARHSGRALDVPNLSTANGVQLIQWDYVADSNQQFQLRGVTVPTNQRPATPTITEPSGQGLVSPFDVHMETGPFSDPNVGNTHACSDWEILVQATGERVWFAPCAVGIRRVHVHLGDGTFTGSRTGATSVLSETNHIMRTRHKDNSGIAATEWSLWATRAFRTSPTVPGGPNMWTVPLGGYVVEPAATGFQLPVNIAFVPNANAVGSDSPYFYVTELYGTIKVVTRNGAVSDYATNLLNFNPNPVPPDPGFPGSGEKGLSGIVVDPVSGDVFASMLYRVANGDFYPKVVRFHSNDGGRTAATQTVVLDMSGETQGASHQISNLSIGPDGKLYVHVGDGFVTATALNLDSFRGKILRVNFDGSPPSDNPFFINDGFNRARDYVFAYGFRNPFGGAWRAADGVHYEVENGPGSNDRFAKVVGGQSYGWNGSDASMTTNALYNWSYTVAPVNIIFVQSQTFGGSGFPTDKLDHAFVSESGPTYAPGPQPPGNQPSGKRITEFTLAANGAVIGIPTTLVEYRGTGFATVVGLAAGPDGIYFSDLYKDNGASPIERGATIWRVRKH
jgi:glucose/arabinose dehydrogenase